ncbi:hypothetical protein GCM10027187_20010 [Streptosporangium sandarakinum]|uniref:Uncharacterized protein n=1 Tax=Streptosporangium sandarakinum TaxID=1260955 RepID=A0A852V8I9_9ACTN|nr:hypothetical protein [Streptosporangium sandarakinum]NYF42741.1 hypothetical protein [Streptosporangium sandarakinum]
MTAIVFAAAEGDVSPGVLGFLVVAAIGFALFLLVKSMRKQISKIDLPADREPRKPGKNA